MKASLNALIRAGSGAQAEGAELAVQRGTHTPHPPTRACRRLVQTAPSPALPPQQQPTSVRRRRRRRPGQAPAGGRQLGARSRAAAPPAAVRGGRSPVLPRAPAAGPAAPAGQVSRGSLRRHGSGRQLGRHSAAAARRQAQPLAARRRRGGGGRWRAGPAGQSEASPIHTPHLNLRLECCAPLGSSRRNRTRCRGLRTSRPTAPSDTHRHPSIAAPAAALLLRRSLAQQPADWRGAQLLNSLCSGRRSRRIQGKAM